MRQHRIPEGETPKLTDFVPEKLFHHIVTRGMKYTDYVNACDEAKKEAERLRRKMKEDGNYNPETFIQDWKQIPAYLRAESLYAQYLEEAEEIYRQSRVPIGKETRQRVTGALAPA